MEEDFDWISLREIDKPDIIREKRVVYDEPVSKILGFAVPSNDPRLIRLVVKWKAQRKGDDDTPDNFLKDPQKIIELKKTFNVHT